SQWEHIFFDSAMTVAAVDRLVHHSTMIDIQAESFRKRYAESHQQILTN
ncbi:MAG: ATP-binding protein, partial [Mariprofundus sp.]|nr:ATP-binding protein [Mariprofundus sp.]